MRVGRRAGCVVVAMVLVAGLSSLAVSASSPPEATAEAAAAGHAARPAGSRPVAGGRLFWDLADDLDLIGDLWARLPLWRRRAGDGDGVYLHLDLRTAIEQASDLTFDVRDLQYSLDIGWRARFSQGRRNRYSTFVGQRGVEAVDADGQPYLRYAGFGFEHGDLLDPTDPRVAETRLDWQVSGGPVLEEREVEADFLVRAGARYVLLRRADRPVLSLDAKLDGLLDGSRLRTDISGGPTVTFFLSGGTSAAFSLHYQRSRHPLGIGHSAWLAGFHYRGGGGPLRRPPPDVHGLLSAGGGDDSRAAARLRLRFSSPPFAGRYHAAIVVDANVLTGNDPGELYYIYDVGFERRSDAHHIGAYFYHRSNHVLAEPNPAVTSINVLEAGIESVAWERPGRRPPERSWGRLDYRARAGYLIDSAFGEERRWHARAGLRWRAPLDRPWQPYVSVEFEAGDVERAIYAAGTSPANGVDLQLEWRDDDQFFGSDGTALLLTASYGF